MEYIYLVSEYYNNGEYYEDECDGTNNLRAFLTKEEAEQFIDTLNLPTADYPENEKYFEVHEGDDVFQYCCAFGSQFRRYFLHKTRDRYNGKPMYETLAYFIEEVPFGTEK